MEHLHLITENCKIDAVDVSFPTKKKLPDGALSGREFRNHGATLGEV
jgi:hypothetical protein